VPSLLELQQRVCAALFDAAVEPAALLIRDDGIAGAERLAIYRNNLREGFRKTLALEFPVIERLVGDAYFRQLALEFQARHPSRSGDLHHVGAPFASYLTQRFADTKYAYLVDLARLEWAREQALVAADAPPLGPGRLRVFDPESYGALQCTLHPACALVSSAYPILRIWQMHQPGAQLQNIDPSSGGENVLVHRGRDGSELHLLSPACFAWLEALDGGAPLGKALDSALLIDGDFDLGAALARMFALGVFVDVRLAGSADPAAHSGPA
jgi:hypothetical protein